MDELSVHDTEEAMASVDRNSQEPEAASEETSADHEAVVEPPRLLFNRTAGDPFGTGFTPPVVWSQTPDYPRSPAYSDYLRNPMGEGRPMWQRALYRIFDEFLAFHTRGHEPSTPADDSPHSGYHITYHPGLLLRLLREEMESLLAGQEELTNEEFCVLLRMDYAALQRDIDDGFLPGSDYGDIDARGVSMMIRSWMFG
jgi:hypothetical protein